jgi:hypothetical protein
MLMRTGTPNGSTSGLDAALTIVNTGSINLACGPYRTQNSNANPGGRPEHYLRGRDRPNGPCTRGLLHLEFMLEERTIVRSVLDQTENHSRQLGRDCRVSLVSNVFRNSPLSCQLKLPLVKSCPLGEVREGQLEEQVGALAVDRQIANLVND